MRRFLLVLGFMTATAQAAGVVDERIAAYRAQGAADPDVERGAALWRAERMVEGRARSCTSCHTAELRREGRQVNTGKPIEPLAPSVNSKRLTSVQEVEKWFQRNCDWTLGRACTPQEKADLIAFIAKQ